MVEFNVPVDGLKYNLVEEVPKVFALVLVEFANGIKRLALVDVSSINDTVLERSLLLYVISLVTEL